MKAILITLTFCLLLILGCEKPEPPCMYCIIKSSLSRAVSAPDGTLIVPWYTSNFIDGKWWCDRSWKDLTEITELTKSLDSDGNTQLMLFERKVECFEKIVVSK